jgi:predicted phosphoadenosine phosphosulfate sulfurtransferase
MQKLQLQNQLAAYLTSEESEMILAMAKRVSTDSDEQMNQFKQILRKKRLQMIDDQWTKEAKAADKNAAEDKLM